MSELEDLIRKLIRDELAKSKPEAKHVTVAEYARSRSISESTVRAAIREKRLDVLRVGRAVRVPANQEITQKTTADDITERATMRLLGGGKRG